MVRHRSKKLPFYRIPGFKLVKTATINNMYKSQGAVKEDAIVLDDEDENSVAMSEGGKVGIVDLSEPELEAQVHSTSDSGQGTTSDRPNQGFSPNPSAAKIPEKHIQQALPLSTQIAQEIDKVKGNPILTQTVSAGHPSASSAIASAKDSQWGSHSGGCGLGTKQTSEARNHSTKQAARNTSFVQGTPRKDASPVSSQASRPNNSKAVPGMTRKPAMKKSDPPPTYDVLKPNRKRPLAEMAVGQLFTPGQVISNSEWENTKRQRLEKRQSRALQDITEPSNFQEMFDVGHSQTVNHGDAALSGEAEYSTVENTIDDTINMPDEEYRAPNHRQADKARKYVHFLDDDLETARMTATGPEKATFEPDSPTASKDLDTTVHPTTGGKGISAATLAAWQAESEKTKDTVDIHYEPVYQYFVSRREGKAGNGDIDEANATRLGPFFRLEEANTVASEEIHHPIEHDGLDGVPSKAWSFLFEQDELGMQTHMAEVVGIRIEAEVQRELAPTNSRPAFPSDAFRVARTVFVVQEMSWIPQTNLPMTPPISQDTEDEANTKIDPPACTTVTHCCATTLERANKRAAEQWLECLTGRWSDFGTEGQKKEELEREVRRDLREMGETCECFEREVEFSGAGWVKFWVVAVRVEGPRN